MAVEYAEGDSIDLESETDTALAALELQVLYKTIEVQYRQSPIKVFILNCNNITEVQYNRGTIHHKYIVIQVQ